MCGIAGFFSETGDRTMWAEHLSLMTGAMSHRGPDDHGSWFDCDAGIAFGHRRLSIIDLSPEGHQPMVSRSGRYRIVFNGEIYNFAELRAQLEASGHRFRGHSDTEVILCAFEQWGITAAVKRFVGMFAFAVWEPHTRTLTLGRDRLGEKPVYYGWVNGLFMFGSELKALRAHPLWQAEINRDALALFMRHNYIPAPHSIYRGVHKLAPGTTLSLRPVDLAERRLPEAAAYWSARDAAESGTRNPFKGTDGEALAELDGLLRSAIRQQMVADVPLGAFLSGGIDSSAVVALMQAQSSRPVKTFTIGFHERGYDEANHAREVAQHLGTEHTELYVTPGEAREVIPRLASIYDEPFSDSSQIPTLLVAELARRQVTVCLSGDGGDELFCGYTRYAIADGLWRKIGFLPPLSRKALAGALRRVPISFWNTAFGWSAPILNNYGRPGRVGHKVRKVAEVLDFATADAMYRRLCSHWQDPGSLVLDSRESSTAFTDLERLAALSDLNERMMFIDTISYLPDDILVKVDRASMAVSLESRVPLLNHHVVEFAWRLPMKMKVRNGQRKWLLRQLLQQYIPKQLIDRPKMGFGIPIGEWLRGPLRDWAESLLDEKRLREDGFFFPKPIRERWIEHLSGKRNWQYSLWDVLMYQSWLEQGPASSSPDSTSVLCCSTGRADMGVQAGACG